MQMGCSSSAGPQGTEPSRNPDVGQDRAGYRPPIRKLMVIDVLGEAERIGNKLITVVGFNLSTVASNGGRAETHSRLLERRGERGGRDVAPRHDLRVGEFNA